MPKFLKLLILVTFTFVYTHSAHAQSRSQSSGPSTSQFYFEETFFPDYVNTVDPVNPSPTNPSAAADTGWGFFTNTTLGYAIQGSWLVGLTYCFRSITTDRPMIGTSEGHETSTAETKYGATIGWLGTNARVVATYFLGGEKEFHERYFDNTGTTTDRKFTNKEISGFQLTLGWSFNINPSFSFGPSLVYTTTEYAKQSSPVNVGGSTPPYSNLATKGGSSELKPMISMVFKL